MIKAYKLLFGFAITIFVICVLAAIFVVYEYNTEMIETYERDRKFIAIGAFTITSVVLCVFGFISKKTDKAFDDSGVIVEAQIFDTKVVDNNMFMAGVRYTAEDGSVQEFGEYTEFNEFKRGDKVFIMYTKMKNGKYKAKIVRDY